MNSIGHNNRTTPGTEYDDVKVYFKDLLLHPTHYGLTSNGEVVLTHQGFQAIKSRAKKLYYELQSSQTIPKST